MRPFFLLLLFLPFLLPAQQVTIVLPASPTQAEIRAGKVLRQYLGEMTGATPVVTEGNIAADKPIVFIGRQAALQYFDLESPPFLEGDAFFLQGKNNVFHIAGSGEMATEYGAYTLLEMLGCRKFSPSDSLIPKTDFLQLPEYAPRLHQPAFSYRELHFPSAYDPAWARWHKLITKPQKEAEWGMFVHTFDALCAPEKYFERYPEFFSWNGKAYSKGQLCLSNDTVKQIVIASLRKKIAEQPKARIWSVSQNDNYDYCKCPRCQASDKRYGSPAGTLLAFVNDVAAQFPDKTISTLAYQYTRTAPFGIKPAPNVSICLCSIECNRGKSIKEGCPDFAADLQAWSALTANLMVWDYAVQFRSYLSPFPNWHTLQPNLQLFRENNANMVFEQGSGKTLSEFSEMRAYLLAKLLWDPNANTDSILTDFGNGYYGPARTHIFDYIRQLTDDMEAAGNQLNIYGIPQNEPFLQRKYLNRYESMLGQAASAVLNDPARLAHVQAAQLPVDFAALERAKIDPNQNWFAPNIEWDLNRRLQSFVKSCETLGYKSLHERNYPPKSYEADYHAYMRKQVNLQQSIASEAVLKTPASPKYADGNASLLTDKMAGEPDYHYNWLGFEGTDLEATVKLKGKTFNRIVIGFLQDQQSWVFFPEKVVLEVSPDGKTYTPLYEEAISTTPFSPPGIHSIYFESPDPVAAKFLRIKALNRKVCPDWHACTGNPCWIFVDEVVVQ